MVEYIPEVNTLLRELAMARSQLSGSKVFSASAVAAAAAVAAVAAVAAASAVAAVAAAAEDCSLD